ncbi:MAG: hypothetical protein NC225_02070 [Clostridium sp.]|nr:hypothetical protein [Clostridium sp.]MCM1398249.1 hypothetical protein [Clostridium sp.]MCM1460337.1 hypothetical protein [Bacteroides sp.]
MSDRIKSMYYIEGSAVRKVEAVPERHKRPATPEKEKRRGGIKKNRQGIPASLDRALAFDLKYTIFVVSAVFIMIAACTTMLFMESRVKEQKDNINSLEAQLETMQADNAAYKASVDSMYTLDDIYDVATNELGMVYARSGQIVYYEGASEDYVKQYQDVPEAN